MKIDSFKAYDVRGRVPDELNADIAYRIGRAYAAHLRPRRVALGHDVRLESPVLADALAQGLTQGGADVVDIGLCGTEEIYFATFSQGLDGGIMVTASHNPKGYSGFKLVREGSRPISGDDGLKEIQALAEAGVFPDPERVGTVSANTDKAAYIRHLLGYVNVGGLKPFKIVANPGNGGAGPVMRLLEKHLPFEMVYVHEQPDGHFPHGVPNPLLPESREGTVGAVNAHGADMGIAWDGDFDRCFLFDAEGRFIEGYYLVGLLAEKILASHPGGKIVHDPRLTWNTIDQVRLSGGIPVQSKTGHAFIKARMRQEDAIYGGEMSAHHYFREFAYCDSGMIPWLLVTELMSTTGKSVAELVDARMAAYPCSGEINYHVVDSDQVLQRIMARYQPQALLVDCTDGLSMEFVDWRFNIRSSNTEPLLRLNAETRANPEAVNAHVAEIGSLINQVSK